MLFYGGKTDKITKSTFVTLESQVKNPVLTDPFQQWHLRAGMEEQTNRLRPTFQRQSVELKLPGACVRVCVWVRQTYPIQEAVGPEGHFPPGHRMAEGEAETKQIQVRDTFQSVLSLSSSNSTLCFLLLPISICPHCKTEFCCFVSHECVRMMKVKKSSGTDEKEKKKLTQFSCPKVW